ncbi:MAG: glycosyltransferase family 4 protein [Halobacteriota archaeon]
MTSLKIAHIYELGPSENGVLLGGIEVALLELSRSLARLGHEVTIINGASRSAAEFQIGDVKVKTLDLAGSMRRTWDPANLKFGRQLAFPFATLAADLPGFDIYHGHFYTSGIAANILARRYKGIPVNTLHGSYYDIWHYIEPPVIASAYRLTERVLAPSLARLSKAQIHTGEYFARKVVQWGGPAAKVQTIHNGFDPQLFNPRIVPYDGLPDEPVLFTARRLVEKNGLEHLISAMPDIVASYDAQLVIAGEGPHRSYLERLVAQLNLEKDVSFIGAVPHSKLSGHIIASDIIVIPSLMEASSLFLIEAMACRRPVVATNVGGIPEILDTDCGVLVNARDPNALAHGIKKLLSDQLLQNKLAINAYRAVKESLTWDNIARMTEEAYLKAVGAFEP